MKLVLKRLPIRLPTQSLRKQYQKNFKPHFLTQQKSGGLVLIYVNISIKSRLSQQSNG
jgi:hypothetical protein